MATQEKPTYDKDRLKRDLLRLMQAVEISSRQHRTLRYRLNRVLLRTWRRIIAFIMWPFRFKQRRIERENRRREVERVRGDILQAMQVTRDAVLETARQGLVLLEQLASYDFEAAGRELNAALFASYTPGWAIKESAKRDLQRVHILLIEGWQIST
jgi:hypothetical protein